MIAHGFDREEAEACALHFSFSPQDSCIPLPTSNCCIKIYRAAYGLQDADLYFGTLQAMCPAQPDLLCRAVPLLELFWDRPLEPLWPCEQYRTTINWKTTRNIVPYLQPAALSPSKHSDSNSRLRHSLCFDYSAIPTPFTCISQIRKPLVIMITYACCLRVQLAAEFIIQNSSSRIQLWNYARGVRQATSQAMQRRSIEQLAQRTTLCCRPRYDRPHCDFASGVASAHVS